MAEDMIDTTSSDGAAPPYRVLARKYRPHRFEDLVGHGAMVQTLRNAFSSGRIAQAYMLTGLRGIGKTTTARIIARALNYDGVEGFKGPSVDMPQLGEHCLDIMESRHMDVLELDAASNRGINDIRDLISNVQYAPVLSRYKVYILDEVHMLTTEAFNALLKTLEEPPPHVKFIFATTDPRKVPVTILSRCQRFDLKRLSVEAMSEHLARICDQENVSCAQDALTVMARVSEGSVRDALSLLDQAIVLAEGPIEAKHVEDMLGLADGLRITLLLQSLLTGKIEDALSSVGDLVGRGADPHVILTDLANSVHALTRAKILGPEDASLKARDVASREIMIELAKSLAHAILSRAWQLMIAGLNDMKSAPDDVAALEMIIVRIAYAAHLPPPDKILASLPQREGVVDASSAASNANGFAKQNGNSTETGTKTGTGAGTEAGTGGIPQAITLPTSISNATAAVASQPIEMQSPAPKTSFATQPSASIIPFAPAAATAAQRQAENKSKTLQKPIAIPKFDRFEDIVAFVGEKRDIKLKLDLETKVTPVAVETGRIVLALRPEANPEDIRKLGEKMLKWTGQHWRVVITDEEDGASTLKEDRDADQEVLTQSILNRNDVQAILQMFPGAELKSVRQIPFETMTAPLNEDGDVATQADSNPANEFESRFEGDSTYDFPNDYGLDDLDTVDL